MNPILNNTPILPPAPDEYDAAYMNKLLALMRAYFTTNDQIKNNMASAVSSTETLLWLDPHG